MGLTYFYSIVSPCHFIALRHHWSFNIFIFLLKKRQQGIKINAAESIFKVLLSGVSQGSILGPILFNIFINDLFLFINKAKLANFADDNTIYANSAEMETLLDILEKENETAIKWFKQNQMIVNRDKLQAMVLRRHKHKHILIIIYQIFPKRLEIK